MDMQSVFNLPDYQSCAEYSETNLNFSGVYYNCDFLME